MLLTLLLLAAPDLSTTAEKTSWEHTGRYEEVGQLCAAFAEAYPKQVRCQSFGTTPEGRTLWSLAVSGDGTFDPKARPVVLFQGGIHAGEIDGKDAGFALLRDLLYSRAPVLSKVTAVFVPVFNADGHERFSPYGRPNQIGPGEMGWRTTGQNLNLNRDYIKADAPEMRALLRLLDTWDPLVYLDLHVTDGAQFRHDVAVLVDPATVGPAALKQAGLDLRAGIFERLTRSGHLPITEFYPSFEVDDDPSSGFGAYNAPPRFSNAYWAQKNRLGILVETHSWHTYKERVQATRDTLQATLELVAQNGAKWQQAAREADVDAERLAGRDVVLDYERGKHTKTLLFYGYAYSREPSEISGGLWTRYDTTKPEIWKIPLRDELVPEVTVRAPKAGYIVPAAWVELVRPKLEAHGITTKLLDKTAVLDVEVFRADSKELGKNSYEGRQQLELKGAWKHEKREVPAGSVFVPLQQRRGRIVMHLFEPQGPDALVRWGLFNTAFEQKEYMEPYVAEQLARDMLAKDPALKQAFKERLVKDAAFAASAEQRLDFFYQRSPYWDERLDLYPVVRVDVVP